MIHSQEGMIAILGLHLLVLMQAVQAQDIDVALPETLVSNPGTFLGPATVSDVPGPGMLNIFFVTANGSIRHIAAADEDPPEQGAVTFSLIGNYPNPFRGKNMFCWILRDRLK